MPEVYFAAMSGDLFSGMKNSQNLKEQMRTEHQGLDQWFRIPTLNLDLDPKKAFVMLGTRKDLRQALAPWGTFRITVGGGSVMAHLFMEKVRPRGGDKKDARMVVVVAGSDFVNSSKQSLMQVLKQQGILEPDGAPRRQTKGLSVNQVISALEAHKKK